MAKTLSRRTTAATPEPNIYVGLLFVAFVSLAAAVIFLVLELNQYNWALAQ